MHKLVICQVLVASVWLMPNDVNAQAPISLPDEVSTFSDPSASGVQPFNSPLREYELPQPSEGDRNDESLEQEFPAQHTDQEEPTETIDLLRRTGTSTPPNSGDEGVEERSTVDGIDAVVDEPKLQRLRQTVREALEQLQSAPSAGTNFFNLLEQLPSGKPDPRVLRVTLGELRPEDLAKVFDPKLLRRNWPPGQLPPPEVAVRVVAPGTPGQGSDFRGKTCSDGWCGSPNPQRITAHQGDQDDKNNGRAEITYSLDAYKSVVEFAVQTMGIAETAAEKWSNVCTATLISSKWALSALHCLAEDSEALGEQFQFTEVNLLNNWRKLHPKSARYLAIIDGTSAFIVEELYIPYGTQEKINFGVNEVPGRDLALLKIKGAADMSSQVGQYPVFAGESFAQSWQAVTFVGYGWTNVGAREANDQKQAAFNWLTYANEAGISWETGNLGANGGPCRGDSGGPVLAGFVRGYENEITRVVGVVSYLQAGDVPNALSCLRRIGVGEPIYPHIGGICTLTDNEPDACSSSATRG